MNIKRIVQVVGLSLGIACLVSCGDGQKTTGSASPQATQPASAAEPAFTALPPGTEVLSTRTLPSPSGQTYKVEVVKDDSEEEMRSLPPNQRDVQLSPQGAPMSENFGGTARKAAKLSIASAPLETFADPQALIATLPAHAAMVNHIPLISVTATSNRVKEEKRNVKVRAFLYAASRENDNDFHLILGRAPNASPAVYFTMEISGLPPAGSPAFAKIKGVREAFGTFFGSQLPGSNYDFYTPPIPVEIEGSLFFDMSHATGSRPGPSSLRPKMPVVWEVHPVTRIAFEP